MFTCQVWLLLFHPTLRIPSNASSLCARSIRLHGLGEANRNKASPQICLIQLACFQRLLRNWHAWAPPRLRLVPEWVAYLYTIRIREAGIVLAAADLSALPAGYGQARAWTQALPYVCFPLADVRWAGAACPAKRRRPQISRSKHLHLCAHGKSELGDATGARMPDMHDTILEAPSCWKCLARPQLHTLQH